MEVGDVLPGYVDCLLAFGVGLRHRLDSVTISRRRLQINAATFARWTLALPITNFAVTAAGRAARYWSLYAVAIDWSETGVLEERAPELDKFSIRYVGRQGQGRC